MVSTRFMYFRPGNLFKEFTIETDAETIGANGRPQANYREKRHALKGCLANANDSDRERWKQLQHPLTHTIVQSGPPRAKVEDRLILGERLFIIHAVDDCGGLGLTTIYYAEERTDVK